MSIEKLSIFNCDLIENLIQVKILNVQNGIKWRLYIPDIFDISEIYSDDSGYSSFDTTLIFMSHNNKGELKVLNENQSINDGKGILVRQSTRGSYGIYYSLDLDIGAVFQEYNVFSDYTKEENNFYIDFIQHGKFVDVVVEAVECKYLFGGPMDDGLCVRWSVFRSESVRKAIRDERKRIGKLISDTMHMCPNELGDLVFTYF